MKYRKAAELLPAQLLQELQKHAAGQTLYIPAVQRKAWGEGTGAKMLYARRNAEIRRQYTHGTGIDQLSESYFLSDDALRKIIYQKGDIGMNEIDYSKYFWQNELVRLTSARPDQDDPGHYASLFESHQRFLNEGELELPWDAEKWKTAWGNFVSANQDSRKWVIMNIETHDGVRVGGGNLFGFDERNGRFGLFAGCDAQYAGKGYELAAARLLLDYAFNERRMHICCNYAFEGDDFGNNFYQALDFKKEGVLRARAFHQGRFWDENHYSLTAEEFNAQNQK